MDYSMYTEGLAETLKTTIKSDVNSGIEKSQMQYLDWALETLKRRFQAINKWSRFQAWTLRDSKEVTEVWLEIQPEIQKTIEHLIHEYRQKKLAKEINATSAKAAIREAMKEAGLKHKFTGQTYRAKVSVLISQNRALTIYISYKKLQEQLPHIIEALKLIRHELEVLGNNATFTKAYDSGEWE